MQFKNQVQVQKKIQSDLSWNKIKVYIFSSLKSILQPGEDDLSGETGNKS